MSCPTFTLSMYEVKIFHKKVRTSVPVQRYITCLESTYNPILLRDSESYRCIMLFLEVFKLDIKHSLYTVVPWLVPNGYKKRIFWSMTQATTQAACRKLCPSFDIGETSDGSKLINDVGELLMITTWTIAAKVVKFLSIIRLTTL
ncbi:hypothetical protein CEXT_180151 [Caerostris extrusa]|uniref:Uncharacterized protein n=1 Tax=Caerostris extrusa TaxID=172846 RepID=A0AAV4RQU2_CAEEX|nr:hypothetical protein CEXT_180151 [Caerostris extrusa]